MEEKAVSSRRRDFRLTTTSEYIEETALGEAQNRNCCSPYTSEAVVKGVCIICSLRAHSSSTPPAIAHLRKQYRLGVEIWTIQWWLVDTPILLAVWEMSLQINGAAI